MVILNTLEESILTIKYIRRITVHCVVSATTIKCIDVVIPNTLEERQLTIYYAVTCGNRKCMMPRIMSVTSKINERDGVISCLPDEIRRERFVVPSSSFDRLRCDNYF